MFIAQQPARVYSVYSTTSAYSTSVYDSGVLCTYTYWNPVTKQCSAYTRYVYNPDDIALVVLE